MLCSRACRGAIDLGRLQGGGTDTWQAHLSVDGFGGRIGQKLDVEARPRRAEVRGHQSSPRGACRLETCAGCVELGF